MAPQARKDFRVDGRIAAMPAVFSMGSLQRFPVTAGAVGGGCYGVANAVVHGGIVAGQAFPGK